MKVKGVLVAALIVLAAFLFIAPPQVRAVSSPSVDANGTFAVFGATTSCSAAVTTIAANDLLLFIVGSREHTGTTTPPHGGTVADTHSLTWANRINFTQSVSTSGMGIELWWAIAGAAQAYTVSITGVDDAQDGQCQAIAITGYYATTPFDPNAAIPAKIGSTSSVTFLTNTISTSNPNDLLITWVSGPACTPSVTVGFSLMSTCQNDNGFASTSAQKQVSSLQSSASVTWTFTSSAGMAAVDAIEPTSATVTLPFSCVLNAQGIALGATPPVVTLSGSLVSPTTATCNGTTNVTIQGATLFTATEPADGTTRFRFINGTGATQTACASGTCPAFQVTNWYQCQTTMKANDLDIQPWGTFTFGTFKITGIRQGVTGTTLGTLNPTHGTFNVASLTSFMDCGTTYNFPVSITDQSNNIWYAQEPTALLDISGGGTRTIDYLTNLPVSGGAGAGPLAPGQTSNIGPFTGTDPISQFLNTLVSILSSSIVFYPLLLLFLILATYIVVKRGQKGGRA